MQASHFAPRRSLRSAPLVIFLMITIVTGVLPAFPVDTASAQGTGQYYGQKYLCPPGFDPGSSGAQQAFANCTLPVEGQLSFTIRSNDQSYQGGTQQSAGSFGWNDVPLGADYFVSEALPQGYLEPWVYCEVSQFAAGGGDVQSYFFRAPGGEMFIAGNINAYELTNCSWFNVQPGNGNAQLTQGTTVAIQKYFCETGYDAEPRTLEDYSQDCTTPHQGANFSLQQDLGNAQPTGQNGQATFANVPFGSIDIREVKSDQWRLVAAYCRVIPSSDPDGSYQQSDQQNIDEEQSAWKVSLHAAEGNRVVCVFYNIPEVEGATVYIRKYLCSPDYDETAASLQYLDSICDPYEGAHMRVPFDSTSAEGETNSSGHLELHGVPYGSVELQETADPDFYLARAYCYAIEPSLANGNLSEDDLVAVDSSVDGRYTVTYDVPEGHDLYCYLFNVPVDDDYGSIIITKYLCGGLEVQIGSEITYETFAQQCTDWGIGYEFTATSGGTGYPAQSDSSGQASWPSLGPGEVTIEETLPDGQDSYAVYCTTDPGSNVWAEYAGELETSFNYTVEAGVTLYCHWFNFVPPTNTHVEVVKYRCPEGYDYANASHEELLTNCADTIAGVDFTISNSDMFRSTRQTDGGGDAAWTNVPASTVQIHEGPVPQYAPVRVLCSNTQNENSQPAPFQGYDVDTVAHFIQIQVLENYTLVCHWFNAPAETGQILLTKYVCDLFFTRGDAEYQDYVDNCTDPGEGFHFSLLNADEEIVDDGTTGANGTVPLISPPGTHYLAETETEGYITLAVYCATDQTTPPGSPLDSPPAIDVASGSTLYCSWFNGEYEPAPYDPGDIVLHKYDCPPGYPAEPQGGRSPFEWLFNGCQQPAAGVSFGVEQGGTSVGSGSTDETGTAVISGVPTGSSRISELPREGWGPPLILCATYPVTTGRVLVTFDEQPVENWGHTFDRQQDYVLECFWFNFPPSQGTEGAPIQIIIHKYLCPAGSDPGDALHADMVASCTAAEEGVNFDITGGDGGTSGGPTDLNGYAEYNGVAPGSILIAETPREGYLTLAVHCSQYTTTPGDPVAFATEDDQLSWYLAGGYTFECWWFNQQHDDDGHITVLKYNCHEDYDYYAASREELAENCTQPQGSVEFTLTESGGSSNTSSTDGFGLLEWPDVPASQYTLTETAIDGYQVVRVYCTTYPKGSVSPTDPTYSGTWDEHSNTPGAELHVQGGYQIYCVWYNAPVDDHGYVVIIKYNCEQEYDYHSRDEFHNACTEAAPSVEFVVKGGNGYSATTTTSPTGVATAENVPIGQVWIQEYPPEEYAPWRVYCGLSGAAYIPPTSWEDRPFDNGYEVTAHIDDPYVLWCEWYNAPYEDEAPHVWIQKYNCPEGADWHWNYHQFLSNCHQPGAHVEYLYGLDGGQQQPETTNESGQIHLEELESGSYVIQETLPQGYSGFVAFCQFATPHGTTSYQRADVYNRTIKLHLDYGYVVTCVWFDLPSGWEPPDVSPPSTGHTPLQPTFPSSGTGGEGVSTLPPVDPATPANLLITKYTCEGAYDVLADDADAGLDCTELTDDISYGLESIDDPAFAAQSGLTGDDGEGVVAFSGLAAGSYLLTEELPPGTIAAFINTCTSDRRDFQQDNPFIPFAFAGPDGRIGVTLEPGETLECDWFNVPEEAPGGEVTVLKFACPGATVIVAQCAPWPDGATIAFAPIEGGDEPVTVTTGEDGSALAAMEGVYSVQELPDTACLIDSDAFDVNGNLVVNEGDQIEVRVYNCGVT